MKNILVTILGVIVGGSLMLSFIPQQEESLGAPSTQVTYQKNLIPLSDSTYTIGTTSNAWLTGYFDELCLTADSCETTWPLGGGGSKWTDATTFIYPTGGLYASAPIFVATSTASSTFAGPILIGNNHLTADGLKANDSAGLDLHSSNGSIVANFGAGAGTNATYYGGVNIDGQTRIATSLTGCVTATAGVLSASGSCGGASNWSYNGTRLTPTTTTAGIGVFASSTIGNGTATGGLTISGNSTTTGNAYFAGNVGIGTTTPGARLSVIGSGTNNSFVVASSTGNHILTVTPTGRLGIGVSAPIATLHVNGSGYIDTLTNTGNRWQLADAGNLYFGSAGDILWGSSGSSFSTTVNDTGLIRIGTSTLQVTNGGIAMGRLIASSTGLGTTSPEASVDAWGVSGGKIMTLFSNAGTKFMEMLNTGVTTLLGTWNFAGATVTGLPYYPAFTYATSTAWTGTTTIPLGTAYNAQTWRGVQCFTDTGTLNVSFTDGTNRMNAINASTTVGIVTLNTNNTFTATEKRYVEVGTPASSPTKISCTVSYQDS